MTRAKCRERKWALRSTRCTSLLPQTGLLLKISVTTNSTIKIKKRTFAIPAALAAIPKNPKMAAIIAMTKKIIDQRNID